MERVTLITILLVFLAGYVFCAWGIPLLDNISNTITIWFQKIQGKMAITITEDSVKTAKLKQELEGNEDTSTRIIGFAIPDQIEEEEYDEDDE